MCAVPPAQGRMGTQEASHRLPTIEGGKKHGKKKKKNTGKEKIIFKGCFRGWPGGRAASALQLRQAAVAGMERERRGTGAPGKGAELRAPRGGSHPSKDQGRGKIAKI